MTCITTRKIIRLGSKNGDTVAVTLPIDWFRFNKPDKVDIYYDQFLVITPVGQLEKLKARIEQFLISSKGGG